MQSFKIYRWDAILPNYARDSRPMIYIKPTLGLLEYAKKNDNMLLCTIKNTGSIYDGRQILGALDTLVLGPNQNLPEFINREFYTITLMAYFYEYPPELGEVEIEGVGEKSGNDNSDNDNINKEEAQRMLPISLKGNSGMNARLILLLVGVILLVLIISYLMFRKCK